MDCSMPSFLVLHYLPEFAQTNVHWVGDVDIHLNCFKFSLSQEISSDICFCVWVTADFLEVELLLQIIRTFYNVVVFSHSVVSDSFPWSLTGSSVHGIFEARILEGVVISSSRGSSQPRGQTCISCVSCIGSRFFTNCTTWEAPIYADCMCVQLFLSCLTLCDWPYAL